MVKKRNLFSQITDSRFYEGEPIQTWYVTDNITMTNSSQSYTTTVNYEGEIDTSSTRYGPQGIEYYEYVTTTNGTVTATVHPYEYVSTTSQKDVEVVKNTSVSDSYRLARENSMSFSFSESDQFTYSVGRVADYVGHTATVNMNIEKPSQVTATWWEIVSVYNDFGSEFPTWSNYRSARIDSSNVSNNTIQLYVIGGSPGTVAPAPVKWELTSSLYVNITYSSYETETTELQFTFTRFDWWPHGNDMSFGYTWSWEKHTNVPYLTYYSSSTSWNTLTTIIKSYEVPAQTTSSWVEPKQVSSLV